MHCDGADYASLRHVQVRWPVTICEAVGLDEVAVLEPLRRESVVATVQCGVHDEMQCRVERRRVRKRKR
jgi:hypothetical protein